MFGALSSKAEAQRPDGSVDTLLAARPAPGMFPLATQIRFACQQAQEGVFRLLEQGFAPALETLLDEGRNAGERPGTLADAQARIVETIAMVEAAAAGASRSPLPPPIPHALPNGMILDLTAEQYARDWRCRSSISTS